MIRDLKKLKPQRVEEKFKATCLNIEMHVQRDLHEGVVASRTDEEKQS
jgi:hypothetical protein